MSKEQEGVAVIPIGESLDGSKEDIPSGIERANPNPSKERSTFSWFDKNDGPVERRLILKLDLLTLSFACMGFWVV